MDVRRRRCCIRIAARSPASIHSDNIVRFALEAPEEVQVSIVANWGSRRFLSDSGEVLRPQSLTINKLPAVLLQSISSRDM